MKNSKKHATSPVKKERRFILGAGLFVLILLVFMAGWLTVHMLDLSQGLDQITGTGVPDTARPGIFPQTVPPMITKKVPPLPPDPAPVIEEAEKPVAPPEPLFSETPPPEVPTMPPAEPLERPRQTEPETPGGSEIAPDTERADAEPVRAAAPQSPGRKPSPGGTDLTARPSSTDAPPEHTGQFSIQAGAFRERQLAVERASILRSIGYGPYLFSTTDPKGRTWHTVRFGQFSTLDEAKKVASSFREKSDIPTAIMHMDSLLPAS